MDSMLESGALLIIVAVFWYLANSRSSHKSISVKAPPCLPRFPIIGSLPYLSDFSTLHLCLTEKIKTYGKIFSFYAGSKYMVVLNGHEAIREALLKNSADFTGRGILQMERSVWSDPGKGVFLTQPSDHQRKLRSNCLAALHSLGFGSSAVMQQRIHEELSHMLQYMRFKNGASWHPAPIIEQATMNVIYNLMFSGRFSYDDAEGQRVAHICHEIVECVQIILDVFPIAARLPMYRKKLAYAVEVYEQYIKFCESMVEKSQLETGDSANNFVQELCKFDNNELSSKRDLALIVRDIFLAGTEGPSGPLTWALILLANHPEVQLRAQKEIDSAVPRDRLPSLEDKRQLPYLEAVVLETLRLRTGAPLGIPRATITDTVVGGFHIPAGAEVLTNLWSAHMDPDVWKEPEKYYPERFLDEDANVINKDMMIAFSLGRRSCMGEALAKQEMFLFLSAILQQFTLLPPKGELKVKDDPALTMTFTPVYHTMRFMARI